MEPNRRLFRVRELLKHEISECLRREFISLRKFDELRRLVGVEDAEADSLLEAVAAIADDDDLSPKDRAREPRS